jgi:hypothetical protein
MDETRKAARWRKRRIIYNNDGDEVREARQRHDVNWQLTTRSGGDLIDDFLNARSASLVGTQVDSIWYSTCTSGVTFSHHTKVGEFSGVGISQELVDKYGRDNLRTQVDFSHENDMEAFWSLRMNDVHDSFPMGPRTWSRGLGLFKRDHPEYLMGEPADWEKYPTGPKHQWSSLDFSFPEVREHILMLIQEVCQGYDVDGLELDFLRHANFFRPTRDGNPVEEQNLELMTDLVRRVRKMVDEVGQQRGRPLLIAARTPFTLADSLFVGLDLQKWLAEDLIDILISGGGAESKMTESFRKVVALGHKYDVPVYPCIDWGFWNHWAFLDQGAGEHRTYPSWVKTLYGGDPKDIEKQCYIVAFNSWEGSAAAWRGAAMNVWNAGADGIYIFNGFHSTPIDRWREIGDRKTLANKDMIFGVDWFAGDNRFEEAGKRQLHLGEPVCTHFQVGTDVNSRDISELRFRLHLWDLAENDEVAVTLNNGTLDDLKTAGPNQETTGGQWLECLLHSAQVKRGENRVELRVKKRDESMQTPLVLDAVQLHVYHKG